MFDLDGYYHTMDVSSGVNNLEYNARIKSPAPRRKIEGLFKASVNARRVYNTFLKPPKIETRLEII